MTVEQGEGFAARWSRRKKEVASDGEVQVEEKELAEKEQEELILNEEVKAEDLAKEKLEKLNALTDEDMPDVETLDEDSDYSGFMSSGVSEALRKIALQKLFHGKTYNIRDGLDEYDGDYTSFEKLDPSVITCDMKHILEVEAEKLLAEERAEEKAEEERLLAEEDQIQVVEEEEEGVPGEQEVVESEDHDAANPENLGEEGQEESLAINKEVDNQEGDIDRSSKILEVKGESMAEINDIDDFDEMDDIDDVEGVEV